MAETQTFAALIDLWPTAVELAGDLGVKDVTARAWKARGIPAEYWTGLVAAAARRQIQGVTLELLAEIAAAQAGRADPTAENEKAA
jgi:hypothetical protein